MDGNDWWHKLDKEGKPLKEESIPELDSEMQKDEKGKPTEKGRTTLTAVQKREAMDRKPVDMTPSLQILQDTRAEKTVKDVEDEFRQMTDGKSKKAAPAAKQKKMPEYESVAMIADYDDEEGEGLFKREKSKNLLLGSQIEIMNQVFTRLDKYEEGILRRSEFVMALRTDPEVIDFIDAEAV